MADQRDGGIAWTDETWNPIRGCSRVSAGCAGCYAEGMAARFSDPGQWGHGIATREGGKHRWTGKVMLDEKALLKPLGWKKPRRIFVTSIGDPFHEAVTDKMLDSLFAVMALCRQHTFQLLTKRAGRMRQYMADPMTPDRVARSCVDLWLGKVVDAGGMGEAWPVETVGDPDFPDNITMRQWPLPNLWLGVSVENQAAADERIPHLLATPAAVRFLSCEPLLGPVDLAQYLEPSEEHGIDPKTWRAGACIGWRTAVDWVIAGGESGPKARPMHPDWVRGLRDQCAAAGVPFLFKQWGEWWGDKELDLAGGPGYHDAVMARQHNWDDGCTTSLRVGKKAAGRLLDGVTHDAFPEVRHA